MAMKEADGLFHKAVVQSACIEHFLTEEEGKKNAIAYLKYAGAEQPQDLYSLSEEAVKRCTVPLLIGNTKEEGNHFLRQIPTFVLPVAAKLIHLKVEKGPMGYQQRVIKALTDHIYVTPQLDILKNHSGHACRYEYQYVLPGTRMGCFHASELPVLFGLNDIFGKADDPESIMVGDKMRRIWGSFARTGRAEWEEYRENASAYAISL